MIQLLVAVYRTQQLCSCQVSFPAKLNLRPYCVSSSPHGALAEQYKLIGVVTHLTRWVYSEAILDLIFLVVFMPHYKVVITFPMCAMVAICGGVVMTKR